MAFLAGNLGVHAGQGIFCLGMVELLCLLPVADVVAALAISAELAFVGVGVARDAIF